MQKNNVPFKVAIGYSIVAIVLILAITLVYNNTRSILSINQASREYIKKGMPPTAPCPHSSKRNKPI